MMLAFLILAALATCNAISYSDMFPYGSSYVNVADAQGRSSVETTVNVTGMYSIAKLLDDKYSLTIPVSYSSFNIFGANLGKKVYVNYNGHVTFGAPWKSFDTFTINKTENNVLAIFAPYYSDNDLRRYPGLMYSRLSSNPNDLNRANTLIHSQGFNSFSSEYCIISTWDKAKYYVANVNQREDPALSETNTYQAVLCTDGNEGHVIYHYNQLEWGRSQDPSTNFATSGWVVKAATDPNLVYWVAPDSGTQSVTSLMSGSNVNFPGRWMRSKPILGICSLKANGVYAVNCTHYYFCCNEILEKTAECPSGTFYHVASQNCIDSLNYNCGGINFCDNLPDGNHANTVTARKDDFIRCKDRTSRLLYCAHNINFGSSARCN